MNPQFSPHKIGVCLHPAHYSFLEKRPNISASWFEASSESYMNSYGRPRDVLNLVRQDYPVALHGTGMNLGSSQGLQYDYLKRLCDLAEQIEPFAVSDHFCWTGVAETHLHDLLPLPLTEEAIQTVVQNIDIAQNALRRPLLLENIATYFSFRHNEMSESHFISEVVRRSGCYLIVDLNNAYINSLNHDFNIITYLQSLPWAQVAQIHLATASEYETQFLLGSQNEIRSEVWKLFQVFSPHFRHLPITIEHDSPPAHLHEVDFEIEMTRHILEKSNEFAQHSTSI